jgi:hypothetical protein
MTALKEIKHYKMQQSSHKQPHCEIVVRILTRRTETKIKDVLEFRGWKGTTDANGMLRIISE